jgi:hypothetical protein
VIPADRNWFARICVSAVLAHTLFEIDPRYPVVSDESRRQLLTLRAALEAEKSGGGPEPVPAQGPAVRSA